MHCEHLTKSLSWIPIYQALEVPLSWKTKHPDSFQLIKWISRWINCRHLIRWCILIRCWLSSVEVSDLHSVLVRLQTRLGPKSGLLTKNLTAHWKNLCHQFKPPFQFFCFSLHILIRVFLFLFLLRTVKTQHITNIPCVFLDTINCLWPYQEVWCPSTLSQALSEIERKCWTKASSKCLTASVSRITVPEKKSKYNEQKK